MSLTAEELLAGSEIQHQLSLPDELLGSGEDLAPDRGVVLRALTVRDLQRIAKAAGDHEELAATLMIRQALVEPRLELEQIAKLPAGLARWLVDEINRVSGVSTPRDDLEELVQAPLARACFVLAREFGWTPEEVSGMTLGQILLYLEMARREGGAA